MPLLEFHGFGVDFPEISALGNFGFKVAKSQTIGIVGSADSGKTTLALALAGLLPPDARPSGQIIFDGNPLPANEQAMARLRGNRIGFLFDESRVALNPLTRLVDQMSPHIPGDATLEQLLKEVDLDPARARLYPHQLTAGERQLAMLVFATARHPELLIADDPARGLDPVAARALLDCIATIARRRQMALLLLVREPRALAATVNEVMVLRGGRIVEVGTPTQLYARPQTEYLRDLVIAGKLRTRTLTRPPIGTPLLTVRNLTAGPIADLSFEVRRSEAVAVVGHPRSGKTAVARIVAGLDRATKGTLAIEHDAYRGDDLPPERRREVSFLPADAAGTLKPDVPAGASLTEPLLLEPRLVMDEQAQRLIELVRAVGLTPDILSELPPALPRAAQIKLALARSLMAHPRLLILDDFGDGLDIVQRADMLALFSRLRSDYGLTCLIFTRDIEVARAVADRALVLDGGRIVEEGRPAELIDGPKERATHALVKARLPSIGALPPGAMIG